MQVLVVGGAGYIGSHTVRALQNAGHRPIVFDNLSTGNVEAVDRLGVPLVPADVRRVERLMQTLRAHAVDAVIHFAADAYVGESVRDPAKYYDNNVQGSFCVLEAVRRSGVSSLIFSSTCATYGVPETPFIDEDHPQRPVNPYGWSKLMTEQMIRDYGRAYGLNAVVLRYFN
ncbi:MAG: NAD-dependent epimerase/dehydratase family protein, partial [Planctomycetia bacterium]